MQDRLHTCFCVSMHSSLQIAAIADRDAGRETGCAPAIVPPCMALFKAALSRGRCMHNRIAYLQLCLPAWLCSRLPCLSQPQCAVGMRFGCPPAPCLHCCCACSSATNPAASCVVEQSLGLSEIQCVTHIHHSNKVYQGCFGCPAALCFHC